MATIKAKVPESLSAKREAAQKQAAEAKAAETKLAVNSGNITKMKFRPVAEATKKIKLVFDDSGSMISKIEDATEGSVEFLRNCVPNETAVAILMMNDLLAGNENNYINLRELTTDLPQLSAELLDMLGTGSNDRKFAFGSTPLYQTLERALEPTPTRVIAFSDGEPDMVPLVVIANLIAKYKELKIPIDTVFITDARTKGWSDSEFRMWALKQQGYKTLKHLSDETGGVCLIFEKGKVNFKALKYLTEGNRLMLMASPEMRAKLEAGDLP